MGLRFAMCLSFVLVCCRLHAESPLGSLIAGSRGHSHNDYVHDRPLHEAIESGMRSIEADIFLVDGELLVGHSSFELRPDRTLEKLYLQPLAEHVRNASGKKDLPDNLEGERPLLLLIDIKSDAEPTFEALHAKLADYESILTAIDANGLRPGPVTVVISGNRPTDSIAKKLPRRAFVDGRLGDLEHGPAAEFMPLISDSWGVHFEWRGSGSFPEDERVRLRDIVSRAHDRGIAVRFWATPDNTPMWQELSDAGVDYIGTDDPSQLARFLTAHPAAEHDQR